MNYKSLCVVATTVFLAVSAWASAVEPLLSLVYLGNTKAVQSFLLQHNKVKKTVLYKALSAASAQCRLDTVKALVNSQYKPEYDKPDTKLFINT